MRSIFDRQEKLATHTAVTTWMPEADVDCSEHRATNDVNGSENMLLATLEGPENVFAYAVHVVRRMYRVIKIIGGKEVAFGFAEKSHVARGTTSRLKARTATRVGNLACSSPPPRSSSTSFIL